MKWFYSKIPAMFLTLTAALIAAPAAFGAATIVIQNNDAPNVGFNDPTPATPVGGNNGTTVGQQRLIAFQFAANIWGATLTSGPTITVRASWPSLECSADSAVLGAAGATSTFRNFSGAPFPNTLYSVALANALSNTDLNGSTAEIIAQFNNNIGKPGCLEALHWYYGLDSVEDPGGLDLVAVLLHELGHGLGFQTFTSNSGSQSFGFPSIYDRFLFDNTLNKTWPQMTNAERAASARNTGNLVWIGQQVLNDVPGMLANPTLRINSPPSIARNYAVGTAGFGPTLTSSGLTAAVVQALDPADSEGEITTDACSPLTNATAVSGKIALIDRGTCAFTRKVKNAQNAGAIGVIVVDHTASAQPAGMSGSDSTITIPSVRITLADGNTIKAQLAAGVNATLLVDQSMPGGADSLGRPRMYAPNPTEGGSSISHWDTALFPNQLMEPNINTDLSHSIVAPQDLSFALLRDIGWCVDCPKQPDPPPANDDFANAHTVTGTQGSVNGTNVGATKEPGEPNHAGKAGGASVWYRWQAPATQGVTFTTAGSNVDTLLGVYTGSSVTSLTPVASNDDFSGGVQSTVSFNAQSGVVYYFAVDSNDGVSGSLVLGWNQLPPGTGRGPLTNGATHAGVLGVGNVDEWTFHAGQNDGIILSIGEVITSVDPNFVPWIRLLGPDGALLGNDWNFTSATIDVRAPQTGTYRVLVASNTTFPAGPGSYTLALVKTPGPYTISAGDEGGPMTNGATHTGTIGTGDVDPWTFQATANDNITISIGEVITSVDPHFFPWIRLRGPNGALVGSDSRSDSATIDVRAPLTGTYTVVVANNTTFPDGLGRYVLTLVKTSGPYTISAGDEGGPMTNGATHTGTIGTGDVDPWTFQATANDNITISIGEVITSVDPRFFPWIRLRGPDGALVGSDSRSDSATIDVSAPLTGTYTLVVANNTTFPDGSGSYILTLAKPPGPYGISAGDEGGPITVGATHTGVINIGDLDAWTLQATQNDNISVTINEVVAGTDPHFLPWIRLRGPNGALLGNNSNSTSAKIDVRAPQTGTYTVLVASNTNFQTGPGNYVLNVVGPQPTPAQLILETSGPVTGMAAAFDSLLFLRDPFPVVNQANLLNPGTDRNTRVIVFVMNLQLAQGETASSVVVNLVDSNNQTHDVTAEDVRLVPNVPFTQVIFRLPDNLSPGTCTIRIKAHGQASNAGTIRIRI